MELYHLPVLLHQSVDALVGNKDGTYIDVTFGGGGHSKEILNRLGKNGRLMALDRDSDALANSPKDDRLLLVHHNYQYLQHFADYHKIQQADGILADLGISSYQINTPNRGFAHRYDGPLDMRMDKDAITTAAEILHAYSNEALFTMFKNYGEMNNAGKLVNIIVQQRNLRKLDTISAFKMAIADCIPKNEPAKYLSKVFQALRMEVNNELGAIKALILASVQILKPGGKLVVIAYHSLEDRLVKHFFQYGNFEAKKITDLYGNVIKPFTAENKAFIPSDEEINTNPRARSAKMRIGVKL